MKKKLIIEILPLVLLICFVLFFYIQFPKKSFNDILNTNEDSITKIFMINGTNGYRVVTDNKDKIKELINLVDNRYYDKTFIQTQKVGYDYSYSFYKNNEKVLSITGSGSKVLINGTYYLVSKEISTDSLKHWFNLIYYESNKKSIN